MTTLKDLIGRKIKISYNSKLDEIARDEGMFFNLEKDFIILQLYNDKLKFIAIDKVIRVEEI